MPSQDTLKQRCEGLVLAAGAGERLGLGPKAFLRLNDKSLLRLAVETLAPHVCKVICAVPAAHLEQARQDVADIAQVIEGGKTRQDSVEKLLVASTADLVLLSEVSRPLASETLAEKIRNSAAQYGVAVPFTHPPFPIAIAKGDKTEDLLKKDQALLPQTPQGFKRDILEKALSNAKQKGIQTNSTWQLVQVLGEPVHVVEGEEQNLKITTPQDWLFIQALAGQTV